MMTPDYELIDNPLRHCYEFHIDGYTPKVQYIRSRYGDIYLTHTEVPFPLRRQGIGSQLVDKVLRSVSQQDARVVPVCPFVAAYIHKHPQWNHLVLRETQLT